MAKFSFDINCRNGAISPNNGNSITITIEDCEKSDLIELIDINDIVSHFREKDILDAIGVKAAMNYFDLKPNE